MSEKLRKINENPGFIFVKMRKKNGNCALVTEFEENRVKLNMVELRMGLENYYCPATILPSENVIAEYTGIKKLLSAGWNYDGYIDLDAVNPKLAEYLAAPKKNEEIKEIVSLLSGREREMAKKRYGFDDIDTAVEDEKSDSWFEMTPEKIAERNRQLDRKVLRRMHHPRRASSLREYIELSDEKFIRSEK